MPAVATIEWKDGNAGRAMKKVLNSIADKLGTAGAVQIGFFENERYTPVHPIRGTKRKPLPVAQVAFWMIYGTTKGWYGPIPPRDFMGAAVRANKGFWPKDIADLAKAHNYDAKRVLSIMGESIKDDIVTQLVRWSTPANGKRWAKIKGNNKPLIDDGTMQRAVGWKVIGLGK